MAERLARPSAELKGMKMEDARLEHQGRERRMPVRPCASENLLKKAGRVHFGSAREVEDLEDGVAGVVRMGQLGFEGDSKQRTQGPVTSPLRSPSALRTRSRSGRRSR